MSNTPNSQYELTNTYSTEGDVRNLALGSIKTLSQLHYKMWIFLINLQLCLKWKDIRFINLFHHNITNNKIAMILILLSFYTIKIISLSHIDWPYLVVHWCNCLLRLTICFVQSLRDLQIPYFLSNNLH